MKRKISFWTFIAILLFHTLSVNFLYDLYSVNKSLFIELFCENKDQPEKQCDGHCMISKLDAQTPSSDQEKSNLPEIASIHLFFVASNEIFIEKETLFIDRTNEYFHYQSQPRFAFSEEDFKPPILARLLF